MVLLSCSTSEREPTQVGSEQVAAALPAAAPTDPPSETEIAQAIEDRLATLDDVERLRAVYAERAYAPRWLDRGTPVPAAALLVRRICQASSNGTAAGDYDLRSVTAAVGRALGGGDATAIAEADTRLTALYLEFGSRLLTGRLSPGEVDTAWRIEPRSAPADSLLAARLLPGWLRAPEPDWLGYQALLAGLHRYHEIAEGGGWETVAEGPTLRRGDAGPGVAALRQRLATTGDLAAGAAADSTYDAGLETAVRRYQRRHGLAADGIVGPSTYGALGVPLEKRLRQIALNLERLRWLPPGAPPRYIMVNIPDLRLEAVDGGRRALRMRVIVGKEYEGATPVFRDTVSYVVFQPYWNVPRSIFVREILPAVREDLTYLAEHDYEVVAVAGDSLVHDPSAVDWDALDTLDPAIRIRQRPGDENALGRVKFMFPNRYAIYLHDTPARHLFDARTRALSHGCIRVAEPARLAAYLLQGERWNLDRIRWAMETEDPTAANRRVDVSQPVPVYILYLTAFARDGAVHFRRDLYGNDARGMAELAGAQPAPLRRCDALLRLLEQR